MENKMDKTSTKIDKTEADDKLENLAYIKGINFSPFSGRGSLEGEKVKESIVKLKECTLANTIILPINAVQATAFSEEINYQSENTVSDAELTDLIEFIQGLGLNTILKPTVNCLDGTWRAHISFFENNVPGEGQWQNWFNSYTKFQVHYAKIAATYNCSMFITGCEMVQTEHREANWRQLIEAVRSEYNGLLTYNTDKYQEDRINWWDSVDLISTSAYYPYNDWNREVARINLVRKKFNKKVFFAETGSMSRSGSKFLPNKWDLEGEFDLNDQAEWYKSLFKAMQENDWIIGCGLWSWPNVISADISTNSSYEFYGKPAEKIIKDYFALC